MIISASRRTDIPAHYGRWLYNRLVSREVLVRNPVNRKRVTRIGLHPDLVACIVFWTKDPLNFLPYIEPISGLGYRFYFQFTVTPYDGRIERNVRKKSDILETFVQLSDMIGKERMVWRYDPILVGPGYSIDYHRKWFGYLCEKLSPYCRKCVISFLDEYPFIRENMRRSGVLPMDERVMKTLAEDFSKTAAEYGLAVGSCSETIDLSPYGIMPNKCIDDEIVNELNEERRSYKKDTGQRKACGCAASRDIGSYGTCTHGCLYCYANRIPHAPDCGRCDPDYPMLCDELNGDETITDSASYRSVFGVP